MPSYQGQLVYSYKIPKNIQPSNKDTTSITNKISSAKYYRKSLHNCNCIGDIRKIIHNVDCCTSNKQKIKYNANTKLDKTYYTTHEQYMKSKCKTFTQNYVNLDKVRGDHNGSGETRPNCYNCSNTCNQKSYYKRSNDKFGSTGAVSSSARLLRLKYNNIKTSGKYNQFRPQYRGDNTQNIILPQNKPVQFVRNGHKTKCNC
jgi:hypothetical protein